MLNLDMVGRAGGSVDVSGLEVSPSMEQDLKAAAQASAGLEIRREGPGAGRSDDSSFLDRQVPAINFFTGFHGDYHRPADDWERDRRAGHVAGRHARARVRRAPAARDVRPEFVPTSARVASIDRLDMGLVAVLLVGALILVNAVYVAAEFAAVSVRRSRLRQLADDGNVLAAWLLPLLDSPAALDRYIAACQIGITLSSLVLGAYAQAHLRRLAGAVARGGWVACRRWPRNPPPPCSCCWC